MGESSQDTFLEPVKTIEEFIKQVREGDIIISDKASKIPFVRKKFLFSYDKRMLSDLISEVMTTYEQTKSTVIGWWFAKVAGLKIINDAYAFGVIPNGEGLVRKLRECTERCAILEDELRKITRAYGDLQKKYEEFSKRVRIPNEDDLKK